MYFKILANDLTHHGYTYHEGINVDVKPFDPTPRCGGGLFFTDEENVLFFREFGNKIAEVIIPDGEKIVKASDKYKAHRIILKKIRDLWTADTFKWLIDCGANVHVDGEDALCYAAANGHLDVVRCLVEDGADIHILYDYALRYAAKKGHLDIVRFLIDAGANVHAQDDFAFRLAAGGGHTEVARLLVEAGADIHAKDDWALCCAVKNGHADMVKYLKSLQKITRV